MSTSVNPHLKLLVVDDEPAMLTLLKQSLETHGHQVRVAEDGRTALELLDREPADLVLTDLRMEGVSGIDVLRTITEKHPRVGVMLVTGFATLESALEAMRMGAVDVIQKPINMSELTQKIADFARKHATESDQAFSGTSTSPDAVEVRPAGLPPVQPTENNGPPDSVEKILDIPVAATVQLGRATLQIADLLKLGPGSVLELDRRAGEPVELFVNDRLIALGEIVVIDETFGLRVTSIVDSKQRVQSLGW
jgi:flagellar motor switch protein FliN